MQWERLLQGTKGRVKGRLAKASQDVDGCADPLCTSNQLKQANRLVLLVQVSEDPPLFPLWLPAPRRGSRSARTPAQALQLASRDANKHRAQTWQLTVAECYWEAAPSPRLEREKLIMEPH